MHCITESGHSLRGRVKKVPGEEGAMEGALAVKTVMVVVVVALCGAVPTTSPSQEELSKAQVNQVFSDLKYCIVYLCSGRKEHNVFFCEFVRTIDFNNVKQ